MGHVATPQQVAETHGDVRKILTEILADRAREISILYGGSVKPDNAAELAKTSNVDGFLVGGASLKPKIFWLLLTPLRFDLQSAAMSSPASSSGSTIELCCKILVAKFVCQCRLSGLPHIKANSTNRCCLRSRYFELTIVNRPQVLALWRRWRRR